ncbi:M1 family metallopeptidase [Sinomicrobium weinanense]|uniref:M1 family metallopeptidase n=1 Tax=Sinomicrobium weinanense TaxID=2842200 RepID=A0A926JTY1_9FLAO|nr:M1 family metallopeptidase [Sinomicrobium weinanense]MBC9797314.1 M1 family metallopeptidase [Sinomicrobium weinanense]MBU3122783.1 M1 family metallopeptidase [Sinomicrobium weinanense]
MKKIILFSLLFTGILGVNAQLLQEKESYTKGDTLRGSLRRERNFNVREYHLNVKVDPGKKYIEGHNRIVFVPQEKLHTIQIDLFENMDVDSILYRGKPLPYRREYNAVFIDNSKGFQKNRKDSITFYYSGNPIAAKRAPWDGGFDWKTDKNGKPWIATAVQGTGASAWWPNKDHQSDEPENGMTIKVAVPNGLMDVSNGRLTGKKDLGNGYTRWDWKVTNPINNYDVALNIGDYAHFGETYKGLDMDFYVLSYNLKKAKMHFQEVKPMMDCFQEKFGTYPFKEDSYKMVETAHLGMEHQSAVAYGNKYMKGYLGRDLSGTGIGNRWDFIIIHETGHEWFGNSITSSDIADMWIHEGFTTYSEAVYVECRWGYEDGQAYVNGLKQNVRNDRPIIGDYGVNKEGSGDMYPKGALMLNTIRHMINDDDKWWQLIRNYSETFKHMIVDTEMVLNFFEQETKLDLEPVFDQYLRHKDIPVLELKREGSGTAYRWVVDADNFNMPVDASINGKTVRLHPTSEWQKLDVPPGGISVATDRFFINVKVGKQP